MILIWGKPHILGCFTSKKDMKKNMNAMEKVNREQLFSFP